VIASKWFHVGVLLMLGGCWYCTNGRDAISSCGSCRADESDGSLAIRLVRPCSIPLLDEDSFDPTAFLLLLLVFPKEPSFNAPAPPFFLLFLLSLLVPPSLTPIIILVTRIDSFLSKSLNSSNLGQLTCFEFPPNQLSFSSFSLSNLKSNGLKKFNLSGSSPALASSSSPSSP